MVGVMCLVMKRLSANLGCMRSFLPNGSGKISADGLAVGVGAACCYHEQTEVNDSESFLSVLDNGS